jgi:hypothetical protein
MGHASCSGRHFCCRRASRIRSPRRASAGSAPSRALRGCRSPITVFPCTCISTIGGRGRSPVRGSWTAVVFGTSPLSRRHQRRRRSLARQPCLRPRGLRAARPRRACTTQANRRQRRPPLPRCPQRDDRRRARRPRARRPRARRPRARRPQERRPRRHPPPHRAAGSATDCEGWRCRASQPFVGPSHALSIPRLAGHGGSGDHAAAAARNARAS